MTLSAATHHGLYVHVPFCASTCDFCAFYQEKPRKAQIEEYLAGIATELALYTQEGPLDIDTVFFGGGTPGLLTAEQWEGLGKGLLTQLKHPPKEWTVEMAPSTVKKDKLLIMKDLGVTRISMGVQSFKPHLLEALGRLHSPKHIYEAYAKLQDAGFQSINLDLMFALPGQTVEESTQDLEEAFRLNPQHISTYCLTFEEDTALYLKLSKGLIQRDETQELALYENTWELLKAQGYLQYEVSNFAKPGHACLHNVHTWDMQDWLGIGPSAASQWQGKRFSHTASIPKWLEAIQQEPFSFQESQSLDDGILATDACIFGLRMTQGIDLASLQRRFPLGPWEKLERLWARLETEGLLEVKTHPQKPECASNSTLCLTYKGRLLADKVGELIYHT